MKHDESVQYCSGGRAVDLDDLVRPLTGQCYKTSLGGNLELTNNKVGYFERQQMVLEHTFA